MKETICWLQEVELTASEIYGLAAGKFSDDPELNAFLLEAADEEAWHANIMAKALEYLSSASSPALDMVVDSGTKARVSRPLFDLQAGLKQNIFSKNELIEKIVELEFSEWNDIFIYIVDLLQKEGGDFRYSVARLQSHLQGIESFLRLSGRSDLLDRILEIPSPWVQSILVVEDNELIADLIKSLLKKVGNIEIAHNGQDAIKLIGGKKYDFVISDINMPIMDGISLYKAVEEKFPELKGRFLFITGDISPENQDFFAEKNLTCLEKPFPLNVLMEEISSKLFPEY